MKVFSQNNIAPALFRTAAILVFLIVNFHSSLITCQAQTQVTATITFTNAAGITNPHSLTIQGTTFPVTNSSFSVRYIRPTNSPPRAATNVFRKISTLLTNQFYFSYGSSTSILVRTRVDATVTNGWISISSGFGTLTLTTNLAGNLSFGASNIFAQSFTLNGDTITEWPAGGSGTVNPATVTNTAGDVAGDVFYLTLSQGNIYIGGSAEDTIDFTGWANNVGMGATAMALNLQGKNNTWMGDDALNGNTHASNNVAFGVSSLRLNTNGLGNSAFGMNSLSTLRTGHTNIAIGFGAGSELTSGNNNLYIGNAGASSENDIIRIGNAIHTDTHLAGTVHATTFDGALTGNATTATTAGSGDSATAFFSSGTLEDARLSANVSLLGQSITHGEAGSTVTTNPAAGFTSGNIPTGVGANGIQDSGQSLSGMATDAEVATSISSAVAASNLVPASVLTALGYTSSNTSPTFANGTFTGTLTGNATSLTNLPGNFASHGPLLADHNFTNYVPSFATIDWSILGTNWVRVAHFTNGAVGKIAIDVTPNGSTNVHLQVVSNGANQIVIATTNTGRSTGWQFDANGVWNYLLPSNAPGALLTFDKRASGKIWFTGTISTP